MKKANVLQALLLAVVAVQLGCSHSQAGHQCLYKPPDISEVRYASRATTGHTITKRQEVDHQPIRIVPHYTSEVEALPNETRRMLKEEIMGNAIAILQSVLSVIPLTTNLLLGRGCVESSTRIDPYQFCVNGCTSITTCGIVEVPEEHLGECRICDGFGNNCTSTGSSGPGVANTDFLLYVTASDDFCGSSTLAFASHCQLDPDSDRPVAGFTNLCPNNLYSFISDQDTILRIVIHEISHALGFSSALYAFFRDKQGNPRTPRDYFGFPDNGVIANFGFRPSNNTLSVQPVARETANGPISKNITELVTPAVVREGRAHFNCSSLEGVEVEDGGGPGTALSHWEERILENELMTGFVTVNMVLSRLTLALFEDSGWYEVNYDNAEQLRYGQNLGCSFSEENCLTYGLTTAPFCSEFHFSDYTERGLIARYSGSDSSCHYDRRSVSACTLLDDASPPPEHQYFANPNHGGFASNDHCPIQAGLFSCLATESQPSAGINAFGEVHSNQSRCFNFEIRTEWMRQGSTVTPQVGGACYEAYCERGPGGVIVNILGSNYTCDSPQREITIMNDLPGSYSVNITILCPRCEDICWDVPDACISAMPPSVVAPTTSEVVAPTTSEVVAPTTSEVVAPTTSEHVAPTTSEVVAPTNSEVVAPTTSEVVAPTTSEAVASTTSEVVAPTTSEVGAPTTSEVVAPTTSEVVAPTTSEAVASTTSEAVASTTSEVVASTTSEVVAPTTSEVVAPTTSEVVVPTTSEVVASTTSEVVAPTTSEVVAPTTSEVVVPTTSQVIAPTNSEEGAPTSTGVSTSTAPSPTPALQVQFDPQNYNVTEGDVVNITLVPSSSNYEFDFNVTLQYTDGSATAGSDYRPGPYTVSFSAGQPLAVLMVSTIDDGMAELSENFTVMIKSVDSLGHVEIGSRSSSLVRIDVPDACISAMPPSVVAPTTSEVVAPTTSEVVAPTTSEVVAPTTSEHVAPTTSEVVAPTNSEVVAPTTSEVVAPTTSEAVASTTSEVVAPTTSEVGAPTTSEVVAPTTSEVVAPTTSEAVASTTSEAVASTTSEVVASTTSEVVAPTTSEVVAPTTSEVVVPTTSEVVASTTSEVVAPTTSEVVAPTTSEVVVPTTSQVIAPTNSEEGAPTSTGVSTSTAPSPTPALQVQFDPQNYNVTEGDVVNITLVPSSSNYEFDFNVTLQYTDGSATAGSDYRPGPYTVSFSAGQPLAVLMVSTIDDGMAELSENFTVMIKSVDSLGHVEIGSRSSSLVRIVNVVDEQVDALANISAMENLNLTPENITFLIGTVNEVLDSGPIDNMTGRILVAVFDAIVAAINGDTSTGTGVTVLNTFDRVAGTIPVTDEMPVVQVEDNVVVEVVARRLTTLQQNGLTTTGLGSGNMVVLPPSLFNLLNIPDIRITAVSINNRNLLPPRSPNSRLRGNIISVNLNTAGGVSNLSPDQRIRLTFNQDANTNDAANGVISCVFYDDQANDWSTDGCEILLQDAGTVTCACTHLTAFSILQSPADPAVSTDLFPVLVVTLSVVGGAVLLLLIVIGAASLIKRSRQKSKADAKLGEMVTVGDNSFENNAVAPTIPGTTGNTGWPLQSDVLAPPPADPMFVMTISNQAAN